MIFLSSLKNFTQFRPGYSSNDWERSGRRSQKLATVHARRFSRDMNYFGRLPLALVSKLTLRVRGITAPRPAPFGCAYAVFLLASFPSLIFIRLDQISLDNLQTWAPIRQSANAHSTALAMHFATRYKSAGNAAGYIIGFHPLSMTDFLPVRTRAPVKASLAGTVVSSGVSVSRKAMLAQQMVATS